MLIILRVTCVAGQNVLTLQAVLDSVIASHPSIKLSDAQLTQQSFLIGSSVSLPNTSVEVEYLGDEGYTLFVEQEFDFPTVYATQKIVERTRLKLLEGSRAISVYDLRYEISRIYTDWQYRYMLVEFLRQQDSIYNLLHENAKREFDAGLIDFVDRKSVV